MEALPPHSAYLLRRHVFWEIADNLIRAPVPPILFSRVRLCDVFLPILSKSPNGALSGPCLTLLFLSDPCVFPPTSFTKGPRQHILSVSVQIIARSLSFPGSLSYLTSALFLKPFNWLDALSPFLLPRQRVSSFYPPTSRPLPPILLSSTKTPLGLRRLFRIIRPRCSCGPLSVFFPPPPSFRPLMELFTVLVHPSLFF